jgi:hypothetical protein
MAINVNANSVGQLFDSTYEDSRTLHDVFDVANAKAYRAIQRMLAVGEVVAAVAGFSSGVYASASHLNPFVIGIAQNNISGGNYGYIQSFGFATAQVEAGTAARRFLVPSANPGILREADAANPEFMMHILALLGQ